MFCAFEGYVQQYSELQLKTSIKKEANLNTEPCQHVEQIFRIFLSRFHDHIEWDCKGNIYDSGAPNEPSGSIIYPQECNGRYSLFCEWSLSLAMHRFEYSENTLCRVDYIDYYKEHIFLQANPKIWEKEI